MNCWTIDGGVYFVTATNWTSPGGRPTRWQAAVIRSNTASRFERNMASWGDSETSLFIVSRYDGLW